MTAATIQVSLGARFVEALGFAARLHAGQVRKGTGIPYVSHLLAVAGLVLEDGGDEDEAIAALLHDAAEDQGGTAVLDEIRERFGDRVAAIVRGCSDPLEQPKPPWRPRKETYLRLLRSAPPDVLRVALADKVHNARSVLADLRTLGPALWARFNAPRDDQLWYFRALVDLFGRRYPGPLADELGRIVAEIERLG